MKKKEKHQKEKEKEKDKAAKERKNLMDKFTPKEEMTVKSNASSNPSSFFANSGGYNASSNFGANSNSSSNYVGSSFKAGRSNYSPTNDISSSPVKSKNEGYKPKTDFDFDSLLDEQPQDGKNQYTNDLDFETNKISQKPLNQNANNGSRMRSARRFLEENNDMDFGIQKSKSTIPDLNQGMGSGSNYHFGRNNEFQGFTGGMYQPQGSNLRMGASEFDFGRRGQVNDNMMIGGSDYGIRNDNKGISSGSTGLFGSSSRRRK